MLELTTSAILERLDESAKHKNVRKQILDDESKVNDDNYDFACAIFNETSIEYFRLGFQSCFSLMMDLATDLKVH